MYDTRNTVRALQSEGRPGGHVRWKEDHTDQDRTDNSTTRAGSSLRPRGHGKGDGHKPDDERKGTSNKNERRMWLNCHDISRTTRQVFWETDQDAKTRRNDEALMGDRRDCALESELKTACMLEIIRAAFTQMVKKFSSF